MSDQIIILPTPQRFSSPKGWYRDNTGNCVSYTAYAELQEECEILKRHNVDLCKINKELGDVARATEFKRVQLDRLLENIDLAVGDGCEGINYDELRRLMIFWSEIE